MIYSRETFVKVFNQYLGNAYLKKLISYICKFFLYSTPI